MTEPPAVIDLVRDRGDKKPIEADRQIEAALSAPDKTAKRKSSKNVTRGAIAAGVLIAAIGLYYLSQPIQGDMAFGLCKVFLERQALFPQSLRLSTVEELETSVRIWYTSTSSFGEYRLEPIQCYFRPDPLTGSVLERVKINRREVDPAIVEAFNKTLPALLATPIDLSLPSPLPDSLEDLHIETDKFRNAIFGE